jgi:hypothetical protein
MPAPFDDFLSFPQSAAPFPVGVPTKVLILTPLFRWFSLLIRSNFALSKKVKDGFGRNESFKKQK